MFSAGGAYALAEGCQMKQEYAALRRAVMLQVNEALFRRGVIGPEVYRQMKCAIVDRGAADGHL